MDIKNTIMHQLRELHVLSQTEFVVLYGSVRQKKNTPLSDIDVCISLKSSPSERLKTRMKLLGKLPSKYDLQIFEDLPLYLKKSILSGDFLYCRDKKKTFQRAMDVIRNYDDFAPIYSYYITRDKSKVQL